MRLYVGERPRSILHPERVQLRGLLSKRCRRRRRWSPVRFGRWGRCGIRLVVHAAWIVRHGKPCIACGFLAIHSMAPANRSDSKQRQRQEHLEEPHLERIQEKSNGGNDVRSYWGLLLRRCFISFVQLHCICVSELMEESTYVTLPRI